MKLEIYTPNWTRYDKTHRFTLRKIWHTPIEVMDICRGKKHSSYKRDKKPFLLLQGKSKKVRISKDDITCYYLTVDKLDNYFYKIDNSWSCLPSWSLYEIKRGVHIGSNVYV